MAAAVAEAEAEAPAVTMAVLWHPHSSSQTVTVDTTPSVPVGVSVALGPAVVARAVLFPSAGGRATAEIWKAGDTSDTAPLSSSCIV